MKTKNILFYENQILRTTNYFLLCSIQTLEKTNLEKTNELVEIILKYENIKKKIPEVGLSIFPKPEKMVINSLLWKKENQLIEIRRKAVSMQLHTNHQQTYITNQIANMEIEKNKMMVEINEKTKQNENEIQEHLIKNYDLQKKYELLSDEFERMKHQSLHNTSHIHQLRIINHQLFNEKMKKR
jgi:hypothetical protein